MLIPNSLFVRICTKIVQSLGAFYKMLRMKDLTAKGASKSKKRQYGMLAPRESGYNITQYLSIYEG